MRARPSSWLSSVMTGLVSQPERIRESRSTDGDVRGMTGPNIAADSALSGELPMQRDAAKSSGDTTAAKAERNSPKAGAGFESRPTLSRLATHIVPYDASSRGIVRAYCGTFVQQREIAEHYTVATCVRCREVDAAHEAACNEMEI